MNLTKQQVKDKLNKPNGVDELLSAPDAAFSACWELMREMDHAAFGFMCRAVRKKALKDKLCELIEPDRSVLYDALKNGAPKLRKNAARLMGELKDTRDSEALVAALKKEETGFTVPSIILALGNMDTPEAKAALRSYTVRKATDVSGEKHQREAEESLRLALGRAEDFTPLEFSGLNRGYLIELRGSDMLGGSLSEELTERGIPVERSYRDRVLVKADDMDRLFEARCFKEALFTAAHNITPEARIIAGHARPLLKELLLYCHKGEKLRYRIELKLPCDRAEFSRQLIACLDGENLTNSPSGYDCELRIESSDYGCDVYVKLFTYADKRFSYRIGSVPAAMHPSTAASLLRYAKQYISDGDRVFDPCCGGGTLLIEREKFRPAAALTGTDISHAAIEIARKNTEAAGSAAKYIVNDCLRFEADRPYDMVISNLPFGNRVGSHSQNIELYAGILDRLPGWLTKKGTAVLYTMEFTLLKKLIRERNRLKLITEGRTEAGGLMPGIFILTLR